MRFSGVVILTTDLGYFGNAPVTELKEIAADDGNPAKYRRAGGPATRPRVSRSVVPFLLSTEATVYAVCG